MRVRFFPVRPNKMLVKHFPKNETGRDFVVGDLHGCFDLLMTALDNIGFDRTKDRLFSVGDLVDRGPDSFKCLWLTQEPWFHAVMGNHEDLMYKALLSSGYGSLWYRNGGDWFENLGHDEKLQVKDYCLDYVQHMPWLITVEAQFHVLHADLESKTPLNDADLLEGNFQEFAEVISSEGAEAALWGRDIFYHLHGKNLTDHDIKKWLRGAEMHNIGVWAQGSNLLPVYVGHTPVVTPTRCWAVTNLDTCAFGTYRPRSLRDTDGLTITEPKTDRFWFTNNEGTKEVQVKVVV
jgi:serine/threonine protein phosphatase 1